MVGAVAVIVIVIVIVIVASVGPPGADHPDHRPVGRSPRHATGPDHDPTAPSPRPPYPVGSLVLTVTVPASGDAPARSFPTYVRYPARAGSTTAGAPHAATPDPGPFPLVVFSGGYDVSPEEYSSLLDAWAAAGFVVADPVYPFTTPSPGQDLDENDIVHHPADLVRRDHGPPGR